MLERPQPASAPLLGDFQGYKVIKQPCPYGGQPAHAEGVNVLYADAHAKFNPFDTHQPATWLAPCVADWWGQHHWEGFCQ